MMERIDVGRAGWSPGKDSGADLADRENSSIFAGMN